MLLEKVHVFYLEAWSGLVLVPGLSAALCPSMTAAPERGPQRAHYPSTKEHNFNHISGTHII